VIPIDREIYMLVMLSRDPRGDDNLVCIVPRFVLGQDVGVDDPRSLDFELDGTSEVEGEVEPVLPVTSIGRELFVMLDGT